MVLLSLYSTFIDGWLGVFFIRTMKYGNRLAAIKLQYMYLRYASFVTEFVVA